MISSLSIVMLVLFYCDIIIIQTKKEMNLQSSKTKSIIFKDSHHLPSISKKLQLHPDHLDQLSAPDIKDNLLRSKIDKALKNHHEEHLAEKYERKHVLMGRERRESKEGKDLKEMARQHKSTPKLSLGSLERKRVLREPHEKYLKNQRLSIQLKLPKPQNLNHSFDSDEQSIQNAIFKEEIHQKVDPIVFVLRKNAEYGKLGTSAHQQKVFTTDVEMTGQKMEIHEKNFSLPVVPNLPNRHPSNHLQPKSEKYIKQKFVGQEAVNKFYDRYKNIEKVRQMESFRLQSNPITTILTILQTYNIPPKRMQVIKLKGEEAILDLNNCALGASVSIKAISQIIEKVKIFEEIDLSYNQITPDLTDIIIPNLVQMRRIDLSYNKIGRKGVQLLNQMFWNQDVEVDCELEELNLESNNITDSSLSSFFTQLSKMNYLTVLNLSKNCLGNIAGSRLKEFLINDSYLSQLYLHWCELGIKATKLIFDGLTKNNSLRVLDLSWNQIGLESASSLCKMVKKNAVLLHLDISYCQIDEVDTKRIAKALKHNHTIYGIHYQGNMGYIDFKGNLQYIVKGNEETPISIRAGLIQRIKSINIISDYYKHQQHHVSLKRNICWICQGWQEILFQIKKEPGDKACFIHLDFEYYTGVLMNDKGLYYQLIRMCPPKDIAYFFTRVSASGKFRHMIDPQPIRQIKIIKNDNEYMPDFLIEKKQFRLVELQKINKVDQPLYFTEIFNEEYNTSVHCQPRSDDMVAEHLFIKKPPRVKKPRKKIEVKKPTLIKEIKVKEIPSEFETIFDKKGGDGDKYNEFIRKCVDFDIKHSKVLRILKTEGELSQVRSILQKNYDLFQKIYYFLANNNPNSNGLFSISQTRFQKFIEEQGYETKRVTKTKIRLKLVSCVAHTSQDTQILSFYRPQFFQFLLRLAIEKWCKPKKDGEEEQGMSLYSVSQAFEKMLRTLRKYEQHADSSKWRDQNLTSYEVSIVIKSYSFLFEHIYNKYAGLFQKNMNTKIKKQMFLQEMKTMLLDAEIRKTKETFKDLQIAYRTVKKLEIEDGISDTGIDYVEFLECFCRFAEGLFLVPIGTESSHLWQKQLIQNHEIPLFLKIQKLLYIIYTRNHQFQSKKHDSLFVHGLFPEEVVVLMEHYKNHYEHRDHQKGHHLSHLSHHAKMNSLEEKKEKITLNFLIELLGVKARKIQEENRQKILEMEAERERLEKEAKLEEEPEEIDSDIDKIT